MNFLNFFNIHFGNLETINLYFIFAGDNSHRFLSIRG